MILNCLQEKDDELNKKLT